MKPKLTEEDYKKAADLLGVGVAEVKAVAEVESHGEGFLGSGEPKILFERHKFHKHTNGKYDISHPDISHKTQGGYGESDEQHGRLQKAVSLDRTAALISTSYGRFQILGENWRSLGYSSLQEFINAMYLSEASQLDAFVRFIITNNLIYALKYHRWADFARKYNGPNFKKNNYHLKLARAFQKYNK